MKIAVIGGGISGLSAALILQQNHEVHLFEAEHRLGGHAHTVTLGKVAQRTVHIDTGFLVYNTLTYPHFTKFLEYLNVKTVASDMGLSIQTADGLEWAGASLASVFAQKRNLLRLQFLSMLADILRFNRQAQENLRLAQKNHWTLSELVRHRRHGLAFQKWYLLPMSGAIWSMSYEKALRFPAETFLTFCLNHHLLQVNHRPVWRTIDGGSINYVNQVRDRLDNIHLGSQVQSLRQDPHQTDQLLLSVNSSEVKFDKVVLATHGPVSRQIVQAAFPELAVVLTPLQVSRNRVDLHQDSSVMPRKKICWSSWNVSARESITDQREIDLTYYLNKLQPLNSERDHFITLNSHKELSAIDQTFIYDHPQFDFAAIRTQERLPEIQGRHGIYLAGAWTRYGFHEDGILSAVTAARLLGSEPPWM